MAIAYQYNATGYYAGEIEDHGLLPSNATYTAPQEQAGYIPRWNDKKWEQVKNHKGQQGYLDGQPHTIKDYGPLPSGWSDTPPPPTLEEAKAQKWAEVVAGQAAAMGLAKAAYPDDEREGWPFKLPEAEAVLAGQNSVTPYLDAELAGAGGLYQSKEELAQKILANNAAFKALHGFINGQKTAMFYQLDHLAASAGATAAKILALPVNYTLPVGS